MWVYRRFSNHTEYAFLHRVAALFLKGSYFLKALIHHDGMIAAFVEKKTNRTPKQKANLTNMLKHWCHSNGLWIIQKMLEKDTTEGNESQYLSRNWWRAFVSCIKNKSKGRNRQCSEAGQTTQKGSNWEVTSTSSHQQIHRNTNIMSEIKNGGSWFNTAK